MRSVWLCLPLIACATGIEADPDDELPADDDQETSQGAGGTTPGHGGAGGESATTTTSTTATTTTTTTGGGSCDGSASCPTCQQCAFTGPCSLQYNSCNTNPDCQALNNCLIGCAGDTTCETTCEATYPNGASDLAAAANCVFCSACASDCAGQLACN